MEEKLWKTLQRLTKGEFHNFKWLLKRRVLEDFPGIPEAQLEEAERSETVDLMVQEYQRSGALEVTLKVLQKISRNDLVEDLLEASKHFKDLQNGDDGTRAELKEKIEQMIHERRTKIEEIRRSAAVSKRSAERYVSESERTLRLVLQSVVTSQEQLVADIQEKQKAAQRQADAFVRDLEQEIQELARSSQQAASPPAPTRDWTAVSVPPPPYGRKVASTLQALEERLSSEKEALMARAKLIRAQEFSKDVTLDPDTANAFLVLSADGKRVHCGDARQEVADNPRRFQTACNVLGSPGCSSGRFYFQVQVEGLSSWDVGVARQSVGTSGPISVHPESGFWTIGLRGANQYKAPGLRLRPKRPPRRVGVLVDYEDARVSFFDAESAELLHQFTQCSFSEQLLPFFSPGRGSLGHTPSSLLICAVDDHL